MDRHIFISDFLKKRFGFRVHKVAFRIGNTCPNRDGTISHGGCIFCNGEELVPSTYRQGMSVEEQIKRGIELVKKRYNAGGFIAYLQDNTATYGNEERIMNAIEEAMSVDGVVGLSIGTRADCISERFYRFFEEISKRTFLMVEIGVQSINEETLRIINRGHNVRVVEEAFRRLQEYNVHTVAHIILGLPNDRESDIEKLSIWLGKNGVSGVKIHNIVVLRDTTLADMYKSGQYLPAGKEELISLYRLFFRGLNKEIVIHRLTTDARAEYIIAPDYARDKNLLIRDIKRFGLKDDTRET